MESKANVHIKNFIYLTNINKNNMHTNLLVCILLDCQSTKPKSAKKANDSSKTCSNIVLFEGGLPPIGNIVLESSPPYFAHTRTSRRPTVSKAKPATPWLSIDAPSSTKTRGIKRKTSPTPLSTTTERRKCYV